MGEEQNAYPPDSGGEPGYTPGHDDALFPWKATEMGYMHRPSKANRRIKRAFRILAWMTGGTVLLAASGVGAVYLALKMNEPSLPLEADLYTYNRPPAYAFVDEHGTRLGIRGAIVGDRLKLAEMPFYLKNAFLTVEDRRFFDHPGFDIHGIVRAAKADWEAGRFVQGASTITQQLVKTVILTPEKSFNRKIAEVAGAIALERHLSKEEILELYLDRIYLGSGAYGVDGAAHVYFDKSARDVTLAEAAMLAALTTAPSTFSPRRDLAMARQRAERVLVSMRDYGLITDDDLTQARANPADIVDRTEESGRDYFLDVAAEEAKKVLGDASGDFTIITTFDDGMQKAAYSSLSTVMNKKGASLHASQAALVAMAPDGAVRALIGGRNYSESIFNRATQAHRQPGSSFKPMVYLAALEYGLKPTTVRVDQPITIKNWSPDNYSGSHIGEVTLQTALARSINSVAVELGQEVGIKKVVQVAHRLGIESTLQPYPSLAIGTSEVTPFEMAGAYSAFASGGMKATPYTIMQIRDPKAVVYQRKAPAPKRVIAEEDLLNMNMMLNGVVQRGTGRAALIQGRDMAGKTGTSTEFHDAWFVGFTANLVASVWVGNDDSTSMKKVTGGLLPAQIWNGFMKVALKNLPNTPLQKAQPEPEPMLVAQNTPNENDNPDFFDRVGNFFDRLTDSTQDYRRSNDSGSSSQQDYSRSAQSDYNQSGSSRYQRYVRSAPPAPQDYGPPPRPRYPQYAGDTYAPPPRSAPPPPPRPLKYNRYDRAPAPPPPYYDPYGPPRRRAYYDRPDPNDYYGGYGGRY